MPQILKVSTITATCAYADTCHDPLSKLEISKGNTSSLAFRPGHVKSMTVSGKLEDFEIPDLVYTMKSTGEPATPINPGVYVASLTIKNVTATYEFEITRGNLNYTFFDYSAPQNLTYDGATKYASVVLLEEYEPYVGEYTVYYNTGTTEPINAGTYTAKVAVEESDYYSASTGIYNLRQWRFTIAPKSIDDLTYEGLETSYPVGATPDVTITYGDMTLAKDTDYTVEYANNTEPGTATMTITGQGNYTGSKTLEYEVSSSAPEEHIHSYENGICSCGALDARAVGSFLTLEGSIEISFCFEMAEAIYNNPSAKVRFTFEDGRAPLEIPAKDGMIDTESVAGKTLYVYGCDAFAKQMTDTVTAQVVLGENKSEEYAHSIKNYAKTLIESNGYSEECVALVKAMLNYGAYAQKHFGYHIERLANEILVEADKEVNVDASVFDAYAPKGNTNEEIGGFVGADLILESETTLEVYFNLAEGKEISDLSFTVDGKEVSAKEISSGYVVAIENIAAQDLDKVYTVAASDGSAVSTYEVSALSYCAAIMGRETDEIYTDALKTAIKALYLYNDAANKYFGNK